MRSENKIKERSVNKLLGLHQQSSELEKAENKQAEEVLRKSEEKYRLVVENANESIVIAQDGVFKFINPKTIELTGCSPEELLSKPFAELIHPDDRKMVLKNHLRKLKGENFHNVYSFRILDKNGNIKWVEINAVLINWEGKPATLNFLNDITERMRAERSLKESEEKYSALVEKGNDGIVIIQGGLLKFVNQKMVELMGFAINELIEKPFIDFIVPEFKESTLDRYKKRISGEKLSRNYETEIISKDSERIPVEISASLIEYEGKPADMAIIRDTTERKRTEEKIRQKTEDLLLINSLNNAANRGEKLREIIQLLTIEIKRIFSCNGATIYLISDDKKYLLMQNFNLTPVMVKRIEDIIDLKIPEVKIRLEEGSLYLKMLRAVNRGSLTTLKAFRVLWRNVPRIKYLKNSFPRFTRFWRFTP
jgi:PAS domain S-box-containing protein